jgi:hypothetical protein
MERILNRGNRSLMSWQFAVTSWDQVQDVDRRLTWLNRHT